MESKSKSGFTRRAALSTLATGLAAAQSARTRHFSSESLQNVGAAAREKLILVMSDPAFRGRIDEMAVRDLLRFENKSIEQLMLDLLPLARMGSYAPLSNYHVGALLYGTSNSLYLGANIEVPGQVLGLAVHAEQAAAANAYMHGENRLQALAVTAAPCGHCRQFLTEMAPDGDLRILFTNESATKLLTLLPSAFSPKDLGRNQGALPVQMIPLTLRESSRDPLVNAAFEAARRSYSPYTQSPSGIALTTGSGRIFSGSYIENVAFNPSLSPMQSALASVFAAGENAASIAQVVLVEAEHRRISQKAATEATLGSLAPSAHLAVAYARGG